MAPADLSKFAGMLNAAKTQQQKPSTAKNKRVVGTVGLSLYVLSKTGMGFSKLKDSLNCLCQLGKTKFGNISSPSLSCRILDLQEGFHKDCSKIYQE